MRAERNKRREETRRSKDIRGDEWGEEKRRRKEKTCLEMRGEERRGDQRRRKETKGEERIRKEKRGDERGEDGRSDTKNKNNLKNVELSMVKSKKNKE